MCDADNEWSPGTEQVNDADGRISLAVCGASGRMGARVLELASASHDIDVVATWVGAHSPRLGHHSAAAPALAFAALDDSAAGADVVIDFSQAAAFDAILAWCVRAEVALVSGTTGLSDDQFTAIDAAARRIPILWSANFSPGIAMLDRMASASARLFPDWDVEIIEAHHAGKRDAPSGTALALGRSIAEARDQDFAGQAVFDRRARDGLRARGDIGFAVTRAGDIVGEHTVVLATAGERLELCHRATDRLVFARGALHAARWLVARRPGRYRFIEALD